MTSRSLIAVTTFLLAVAGACSGGGDGSAAAAPVSSTTDAPGGETIAWEDVRVFIEYNSADGDFGFHAEFGGEPWATATIVDPAGNAVVDFTTSGLVLEQGLAGVFFESAEYAPDELTRAEFLDRFPEGSYAFVGETLEGETLEGTSTFTHLIPDPPVIVSPGDGAVVRPDDLTIAWEPVTTPAGVEVEVYQLQLFPVDPPEGQDPIDLNIDYTLEVPSTVNEIRIPPEILAPGEDYEFELTIVDAAGNQTFAVGAFTTAD